MKTKREKSERCQNLKALSEISFPKHRGAWLSLGHVKFDLISERSGRMDQSKISNWSSGKRWDLWWRFRKCWYGGDCWCYGCEWVSKGESRVNNWVLGCHQIRERQVKVDKKGERTALRSVRRTKTWSYFKQQIHKGKEGCWKLGSVSY